MDKAWNAIHRCLTDGRFEYDNGDYPLNHSILGGLQLHHGDNVVISVKPADKVKDVAKSLRAITYEEFSKRYNLIDNAAYKDLSADDLAYTWRIFGGFPEFWEQAAQKNHAVVFTADL